jgi:hypothetical protein
MYFAFPRDHAAFSRHVTLADVSARELNTWTAAFLLFLRKV